MKGLKVVVDEKVDDDFIELITKGIIKGKLIQLKQRIYLGI